MGKAQDARTGASSLTVAKIDDIIPNVYPLGERKPLVDDLGEQSVGRVGQRCSHIAGDVAQTDDHIRLRSCGLWFGVIVRFI